MSILHVGSGKEYSTIQSAVNAGSPNDVVSIEPGTYNETVTLDRQVHLRGHTSTPQNGDIIIDGGSNDSIIIDYLPVSPNTYIYIEGVQLVRDTVAWSTVFKVLNGNSNLGIYINKCRVIAGTDMYALNFKNKVLDRIIIEHCYLERGYAHILYANWTSTNSGVVSKVECNNAYYQYLCSGNPDTLDTASAPTVGYGPEYGDYYKSIDEGYFDGYVYEQGSPVSRTLFLHRRDTGALVGTTTSSGNGYYYMGTSFSGSHYIVCLDDSAGEDYNDLIIGNITPTTISG